VERERGSFDTPVFCPRSVLTVFPTFTVPPVTTVLVRNLGSICSPGVATCTVTFDPFPVTVKP
jgi:hypothetical protein